MPDKLPKGWVKTSLGEIRRDESVAISQDRMRGETFELYSVPAFSTGKPEIVLGDTIGSTKVLVSPGDVLLCKINPRINRAWVIANANGYRQIASPEWIVFSEQPGICSDFLCLFFSQDTFRNHLMANVAGVGGSLMRVRPSVVEKYPLLLPPTAEQERIATKLKAALSRLERAEAAARRACERLERYRTAVLNAAATGELTHVWRKLRQQNQASNSETAQALLKRILTARRTHWEESESRRLRAVNRQPKDKKWKSRYNEPAPQIATDLPHLPKGWVWTHVQQLGFVIGGLTKNPKRMGLRLKLPYLRVANVYANELRLDNVASIGVGSHELDRLLLEKGDLLIVEGNGSKDQIGRLAIWDGSLDRCVHQNHIIKVRLVEKNLGPWVLSWFLSPNGRQHIEKVASSTTGLYTLSINKVGDLPIPLPPLTEQAEINRQLKHRLAAADRLAAKLERQLTSTRKMRQSLLSEAFAGHLVPRDLSDEPASVLLERIQAAREAEYQKPKGKRMSKPKSKSKAARRHLLDVLREHTKPLTPERLFMLSGYQQEFEDNECRQDIVDSFYEELRLLVGPKGSVLEKRPDRNTVLLEVKS